MMELEEARREVETKSRSQIEEETARKWAARAVAAYEFYSAWVSQGRRGQRSAEGDKWLRDAVDYYHEAIEHAALADHSGDVLRGVRQWIHRHVPSGVL